MLKLRENVYTCHPTVKEQKNNCLMSHPAPDRQPELAACLLQVAGVQEADGCQEAARDEGTLHKHHLEYILECV